LWHYKQEFNLVLVLDIQIFGVRFVADLKQIFSSVWLLRDVLETCNETEYQFLTKLILI
jgi:hypothetical protein